MTEVYTFRIFYEELGEKIWREAQVSSNYRLDQLGYLILAAFDTTASHLFLFKYNGDTYDLPDEYCDSDELLDVAMFRLRQLGMRAGDTMKMIYDFGTEQVFHLVLQDVAPMPKGESRRYPLISDGAGKGIIDDMSADELSELIEQIDREGHADESVYDWRGEGPWDYRDFDLESANARLKGEIRQIERAYAPFWSEEDDDE